MKTLADRIRYIRAVTFAHPIEQSDLADRLGVSRGAVGNWELGGNISRKNAIALCALVPGCTLEWLLKGKGTPPKQGGANHPMTQPSYSLEEVLLVVRWSYEAVGIDSDVSALLVEGLRAILKAPRSAASEGNHENALRILFDFQFGDVLSRHNSAT